MNKPVTGTLDLAATTELVQDQQALAAYVNGNPLLESGPAPTMAVRPQDADELQQIIREANSAGLNLTVSSSTGRHTSGGLIASQEHIHVDLSHWNEVMWINRRNRVCQIQPGVTYEQLTDALKPHGMTVSLPLAPRSGKSVVAAVMDRQPCSWPNKQWDISDPVASTEFIFGNGELFRTGAAGGPGSIEEQRAAGGAQKGPLGPSQIDFHRVIQGSQGTMGIVTWITLRCEFIASKEKTFLLGADNLDNLIPYIYEVQRPWLGEHSFVLNKSAAAALLGKPGDKSIETLPEYLCLQNIAGFERLPQERVNYQEGDIKKIATKHSLKMETSLGSLSASDLLTAARSSSGETDWRHQAQGHCLSIFFLSTLDRAPLYIDLMRQLVQQYKLNEKDLGIYLQPVVQNHACHMEFMLPYDPEQSEAVATLQKLEKEAVEKLTEAEAFFSRPYGHAQELVFKQNPVNTEVLKKTKKIFDPNQILNAGKWNL